MTYQIFVQEQPHNGYEAMVIGLPDCVGAGETEDEAVAQAKEALTQHLVQGKVVAVDIDDGATKANNPWLRICGSFADDPTWDEFQANIAEYRRELDAEEAARILEEERQAVVTP